MSDAVERSSGRLGMGVGLRMIICLIRCTGGQLLARVLSGCYISRGCRSGHWGIFVF